MPDSVCRVAVQHGPRSVDLALPGDAPVGLLLPSIVDLVDQGGGADEGRLWHLSSVGHGRLDDATTLRDNAIRDGDLLLLTTTALPTPVHVADAPWRTVIYPAEHGREPTAMT